MWGPTPVLYAASACQQLFPLAAVFLRKDAKYAEWLGQLFGLRPPEYPAICRSHGRAHAVAFVVSGGLRFICRLVFLFCVGPDSL